MEFPTYDGEVSLMSWLKRCALFFNAQHTTEPEKVGIASFHLVGDAQLWYGQYKDVYGPPPWHRFTELVHTQFGPPSRSNALGELILLKCTSLVADFNKPYNALLGRALRLPAAQQVMIYNTTLQEPITLNVEMWRSTSLLEAMSLACSCERQENWIPPAPEPAVRAANGLLLDADVLPAPAHLPRGVAAA
jgi:hypothetical protein